LSYVINNNCIACGSCAVVCKHGAVEIAYNQIKDVSRVQKFGDPFVINDNCTRCGACLSVCWPGAIVIDN